MSLVDWWSGCVGLKLIGKQIS